VKLWLLAVQYIGNLARGRGGVGLVCHDPRARAPANTGRSEAPRGILTSANQSILCCRGWRSWRSRCGRNSSVMSLFLSVFQISLRSDPECHHLGLGGCCGLKFLTPIFVSLDRKFLFAEFEYKELRVG